MVHRDWRSTTCTSEWITAKRNTSTVGYSCLNGRGFSLRHLGANGNKWLKLYLFDRRAFTSPNLVKEHSPFPVLSSGGIASMTVARVAFVPISDLHFSSSFFCAAAPVFFIIDASNSEMVSWILLACFSADVLMSLKDFSLSFRLSSKSFSNFCAFSALVLSSPASDCILR